MNAIILNKIIKNTNIKMINCVFNMIFLEYKPKLHLTSSYDFNV